MKAIAYYAALPINDPKSLQDIHLPEPVAGTARPAGRSQGHLGQPGGYQSPPERAARRNTAAPVLGWDVAGVVKAVGSDVTLFKPGDKVFYAGLADPPGQQQ
jgi:hypothetical protein